MKTLTTIALSAALVLPLTGCYESGSEQTPPPAVQPPPTGFAADGKTYYTANCATCHKAGADDTTSAFGGSDLAQKQDMIATDMSAYDTTSTFNLMLSFNDVSDQRVADLKAYFASLPVVAAALR